MDNRTLHCGRFHLDLSTSKIMGVLNCTPDSFSDGGKFLHLDAALHHAEQMIEEGVDIIDVGAESTRPGATAITAEEEIKRLSPLIKILVAHGKKPISIDTRNTKTMQAMLALGVDMINDISALTDNKAIETLAQSQAAVCLMHMRGQPQTMQCDTHYHNLITEIKHYLEQRAQLCEVAGIAKERICIDFGFGFAKTAEQNMALIANTTYFSQSAYPLLIGVSRKSTIGHYLGGRAVEDRMIASAVLAGIAAYQGAHIIRTHDVKATKDALLMAQAVKDAKP